MAPIDAKARAQVGLQWCRAYWPTSCYGMGNLIPWLSPRGGCDFIPFFLLLVFQSARNVWAVTARLMLIQESASQLFGYFHTLLRGALKPLGSSNYKDNKSFHLQWARCNGAQSQLLLLQPSWVSISSWSCPRRTGNPWHRSWKVKAPSPAQDYNWNIFPLLKEKTFTC